MAVQSIRQRQHEIRSAIARKQSILGKRVRVKREETLSTVNMMTAEKVIDIESDSSEDFDSVPNLKRPRIVSDIVVKREERAMVA